MSKIKLLKIILTAISIFKQSMLKNKKKKGEKPLRNLKKENCA